VTADATETSDIAIGPSAWRSAWWPWGVLGLVLVAALTLGALGSRGASTSLEQVSEVAQTIRCPVCDGESVAQSDADISRQIRTDIAQRLQEGQTPDQIRDYYGGKYGDSILVTPQSNGLVALVWIIPVAALVIAIAGLVVVFRRWGEHTDVSATDADRSLVEHALGGDPGRDGDADRE
jgi:cytochrome c-type biogenesis protein CcmH